MISSRVSRVPLNRFNMSAKRLIEMSKELSAAVDSLTFSDPVTHVYNPLAYAWGPHQTFLKRFGKGKKRAVFLGMNPGPWGMAQTGVPFGEVAAVRDWMGIDQAVKRPPNEHPKRPVEGFACARSEVSGRRLWGLFSERYPAPEDFFNEFFILNYCPLVFMGETARNITPDHLPVRESAPLFALCDAHLLAALDTLSPQIVVAIGGFAEKRIKTVCGDRYPIARILHPSPASPAANRDWAGKATAQLMDQGIWEPAS
jgi:single-strand selective monofunctional uracil DNA glycosylase